MIFLLTACSIQPVEFHDSIEMNLGAGREVSELETPYLLGSTFDLSITRQNDRKSIEGWTLEVPQDDVLVVLERRDSAFVEVQAVAAGTTTLQAFDPDGELVAEVEVEVAEPALITLTGAGPARVGMDDVAAEQEPTVLVGGEAKFELTALDVDGRVLSGNGGLGVVENTLLEASVEETVLGRDGNWLVLEPFEAGTHQVELTLVGQGVQTVTFEAVDAIDALFLVGEDESDADDGDELDVWSHGVADGAVVQGVAVDWEIGDFASDETGDALNYTFDADMETDVVARIDGHEAELTVHGGEFSVSQTSNVGCSTSPAAPLGWLAVALGGLLVRRKVR